MSIKIICGNQVFNFLRSITIQLYRINTFDLYSIVNDYFTRSLMNVDYAVSTDSFRYKN